LRPVSTEAPDASLVADRQPDVGFSLVVHRFFHICGKSWAVQVHQGEQRRSLERAFAARPLSKAVEIGGRGSQSVESACWATEKDEDPPNSPAAASANMRRSPTNGAYVMPSGTFQGNRGTIQHRWSVAMIARPPSANNARSAVIHRFHKRRSCVFHSIHRFWCVFGPGSRGACSPLGRARRAERLQSAYADRTPH
jgi:hypothetical protein